jgi:F0F1-type ATP synthase epsilon subunit
VKKIVSDATHSTIGVEIISPSRTYLKARVLSISASNDTGPFDVLAQHHNFISLLNPGTMVVRLEDGRQENISISQGFLCVRDGKVFVFLDV